MLRADPVSLWGVQGGWARPTAFGFLTAIDFVSPVLLSKVGSKKKSYRQACIEDDTGGNNVSVDEDEETFFLETRPNSPGRPCGNDTLRPPGLSTTRPRKAAKAAKTTKTTNLDRILVTFRTPAWVVDSN